MVTITKEDWEKIQTGGLVSNTLRLFLSYSDKDKFLAGNIKENLSKFNIGVFLAHEDIPPTQEFQEEIIQNLKECDAFLPLLTKNFLNSEWTSQEIGIAYAFQKPMILLKTDVDPYGFIAKYQALKIKEDSLEESCMKILDVIGKNKILQENLKYCMIHSLGKCRNFDNAAIRLNLLKEFNFNENQINEIFRLAIINNQIRRAGAGIEMLQNWLIEYDSKISPFLKSIFEKVQHEFIYSIE